MADEDKNRRPPLQLAFSFNKANYLPPIVFTIGYDPESNKTDHAFRFNPDYKDHKLHVLPEQKARGIRRVLMKAEIQDFFVEQQGRTIKIYFKTHDDHLKIHAAIIGHNPKQRPVLQFDKNISASDMKQMIADFKAEFEGTKSEKRVEFVVDEKTHTICVKTKNDVDYIQFRDDYAAIAQRHMQP
jgi:hypothetical protein